MSDPNTFRITFAVTVFGGTAKAKIVDGTDGTPGLALGFSGPEVATTPWAAAPWRAISACCELATKEIIIREAQRGIAEDLIVYTADAIDADVAEELRAYLVEQDVLTTNEEE